MHTAMQCLHLQYCLFIRKLKTNIYSIITFLNYMRSIKTISIYILFNVQHNIVNIIVIIIATMFAETVRALLRGVSPSLMQQVIVHSFKSSSSSPLSLPSLHSFLSLSQSHIAVHPLTSPFFRRFSRSVPSNTSLRRHS